LLDLTPTCVCTPSTSHRVGWHAHYSGTMLAEEDDEEVEEFISIESEDDRAEDPNALAESRLASRQKSREKDPFGSAEPPWSRHKSREKVGSLQDLTGSAEPPWGRQKSSEKVDFKDEELLTVTKIQAHARGHLARKEAEQRRQRRESAMQIQAKARGFLARKRQKEEQKALADGLSVSGTCMNTRKHGPGSKSRTRPAVDLPEEQDFQEEASATKSPHGKAGATKSPHGKASASELPDLSEFTDADTDKLRRIQAGARGMMARHKVRAEHPDMGRLQAQARDYESRNQASAEMLHEIEADMAMSGQQPSAGQLSLEHFTKEETAQMKRIQAAARGHLVRKHERTAARARDSNEANEEALPVLSTFSDADTAKVTKIQAGARGLLARRRVTQRKAIAEKVQQQTQRNSAGDSDKIARIQAGARGYLARKEATQRKAKQRQAAAMLLHSNDSEPDRQVGPVKQTAMTRGFMAHRMQKDAEERLQKNAKALFPTVTDELPCLDGFTDSDKAKLTKIQAGARGLLARKRVLQMQEQGKRDRRFVNEEDRMLALAMMNSAADPAKVTKIQAGARGFLARKRHSDRVQKANLLKANPTASDGLPALSSFSARDTAKLTRIQAGARGMLGRKRASQLKAQQTQLQSSPTQPGGVRDLARRLAKQEEEDRKAAAQQGLPDLRTFSTADTAKVTKIQAGARGLLARKQSRVLRGNSEKPEEGLPDLNAFSQDDTAKVTKIQAGARGLLTRKRTQQSLAAAKLEDEERQAKAAKLQANFRGFLARKRQAVLISRKEAPEARPEQTRGNSKEGKPEPETTLVPVAQLTIPPQRPPGAPPNRRPRHHLKPRPPLDPAEALSEGFLTKRAEQRLQTMLHASFHNVPTFHPQPPSTPPRVKLGSLSEQARHGMLTLERLKVQALLKENAQQRQVDRQRLEVEAKLEEWHVQKEALKRAEEERKRALQEEKEKAKQADNERWKKRGERLSRRVAEWGMEKSEREERTQRETKAAEEEAKKKEIQRRRSRCRKLKDQLAQWHERKRAAASSEAKEPASGAADDKPAAADGEALTADAAAEPGDENEGAKSGGIEEAAAIGEPGIGDCGAEDAWSGDAGRGDADIADAGVGDAGIGDAGTGDADISSAG